MKAKDLAELHEILHAALHLLKEAGDKDDPEELQVIEIFNACDSFKRLIRSGVDEHLIETGNGPIHDFSNDAQAEADRVVHMTVKQFHTTVHIAISLGVDLGAIMTRMGAKFPGSKPN